MKKILILSNEHFSTYKFRKEIVDRLIETNNDVYISFPYGEKAEYFKNIGCKFVDVSMQRKSKNPFHDLKLLKQYKRIMNNIKPDAVLTFTIKPNIYGGLAAKKLNIPYIANITGLGSAVENKGLLQKITTFLYKRAFKKVNTVFFQNEENMKYFFNNKIALGKHELLPGSGVNFKEYSSIEYPKNESVEAVFIGRLMRDKGINELINAAKHFKDSNINFNIYGSLEEDYTGLINQMESDNIIKYHGVSKNISDVYKISDVIIHPTYHEGMSNVLLEASASARPILASNISGCREIVDNNVSGFLFEPRNTNDLIKKIEKFLELSYEERKNMGLAGRAKVEKEFDRQIIVDKYITKIKEIEKR